MKQVFVVETKTEEAAFDLDDFVRENDDIKMKDGGGLE